MSLFVHVLVVFLSFKSCTMTYVSHFQKNSARVGPLFVAYEVQTVKTMSNVQCAAHCARQVHSACARCVDYTYVVESGVCSQTLSTESDVVNISPSKTYSRTDAVQREATCGTVALPGSALCGNRWLHWEERDKYYFFNTSPTVWALAMAQCMLTNFYIGNLGNLPHLVAIETEEEQAFLKNTIEVCTDLTGIGKFYTSGKKKPLIGWAWEFASMSYTNWDHAPKFLETLTHTVVVLKKSYGYKWDAEIDITPHPFICERNN